MFPKLKKKNWNVLKYFRKAPEDQISRNSDQQIPSSYIWTAEKTRSTLTGESLQI
jgi:hypothetical protein